MSDELEEASSMSTTAIDQLVTGADKPVRPVDLSDSKTFVPGVPHEYLAFLRRTDPVHWHDEADGPGFWTLTKYDDCVAVNRDYERFSSARRGTLPFEMPEDALEQQRL